MFFNLFDKELQVYVNGCDIRTPVQAVGAHVGSVGLYAACIHGWNSGFLVQYALDILRINNQVGVQESNFLGGKIVQKVVVPILQGKYLEGVGFQIVNTEHSTVIRASHIKGNLCQRHRISKIIIKHDANGFIRNLKVYGIFQCSSNGQGVEYIARGENIFEIEQYVPFVKIFDRTPEIKGISSTIL